MQQPRIWLVEDEQSIADTLVYMLQQEGFASSVFGPRFARAGGGGAIRRQMSPSSTSACRISAASNSVGVC